MLGLYVTVPIACFRKGMAREYLETEVLPPPSTCYGFLLSMVGEMDRRRHIGCRISPVLIGNPQTSVVLRTVWRVKKTPLGSSGNTRPDYQQLLTEVRLVIWIDSSEEVADGPHLESRLLAALGDPKGVTRFGGLSLGESTHLVNEILHIDKMIARETEVTGLVFRLADSGRLSLPVWVDHVGSAGTRYATGDLFQCDLSSPPEARSLPKIDPGDA